MPNLIPDLKYWYYSKKSKNLIKLGFSSINDWTITLVSFPFTYLTPCESYKFETERDLVFFCDDHNREVKKKYNEIYKIKPPYLLRTFLDFAATDVACIFIYKGHGLLFKDMQAIPELNRAVWNPKDDAPIYDFFKECDDELFNVAFLLKLHKFALENEVFSPRRTNFGRARFAMKLGDRISIAEVRMCLRRVGPCFLSFDGEAESNKEVFKYYNISREYLSDLFHIDTTEGDWPYSAEQTVYDIINFINNTKYANYSIPQRIIIQGNVVKYQSATFTIKQTKNSKWYLCGDINSILEMFKLDSKDKLRTYMNSILGEKKRSGVFPECETRDEIFKLLDKVKNV